MEKVKKVGHEMDSTGNSAGWKGDDVGKVRKASMQVLEKRWHVMRGMIKVEEKQGEQTPWVEGGYHAMEQTEEVKSDRGNGTD